MKVVTIDAWWYSVNFEGRIQTESDFRGKNQMYYYCYFHRTIIKIWWQRSTTERILQRLNHIFPDFKLLSFCKCGIVESYINLCQWIYVASGIKESVHFPKILYIPQNTGKHFQGWVNWAFLLLINTNIMDGVDYYNVVKYRWWQNIV